MMVMIMMMFRVIPHRIKRKEWFLLFLTRHDMSWACNIACFNHSFFGSMVLLCCSQSQPDSRVSVPCSGLVQGNMLEPKQNPSW